MRKFTIKPKYQAGGAKKSPVFIPSGTFATNGSFDNNNNNATITGMDAEHFANVTPEGKAMMNKYKDQGYKPEFDGQVLRFSKGTGVYDDSPYVKGFNLASTAVTGIANFLNNNQLKDEERLQVMQSQQPHYWENMESAGLNNIPAYTQTGGSTGKYAIKGKKQAGGFKTHRLTPNELQQWNLYLDYVKEQGLEGSKELDNKDKNLGASLFAKFKKANPDITINYDIVPSVQQEMQLLKKGVLDFESRHGKTNTNTMSGISPLDGWFGSKTSSYRFPNLIVQDENGSLIEDQGLMNGNSIPQGVLGSGAAGETTQMVQAQKRGQAAQQNTGYLIPKNTETFKDTSGQLMMEDPNDPGYYIPVPTSRKQAGGGDIRSNMNIRPITDETVRLDQNIKRAATAPGAIPTQVVLPSGQVVVTYPGDSLATNQLNNARLQVINTDQTTDTGTGFKVRPNDVYVNAGKNKKYKLSEKDKQKLNSTLDPVLYIHGNDQQNYLPAPSHQTGGGVPQINGLPEGMENYADVNAEEGEVVERGNGRIQKIADNAGTHEEGGVNVDNVNRVLEDTSDKRKDKASRSLLLSPAEVEELVGTRPKKSMTHAKAYEFAIEERNKKAQKIQKGIKDANEQGNLNKYSVKSSELNFSNMQSLPKDQDLFDTIFGHQEHVKASLGIKDDGNMMQNGGYVVSKYQAGGGTGIVPYKGGVQKTPKGHSNAFAFEGGLDAFKNSWKPVLNLDQYNSVGDAQSATYDYLVNNQPDVAQSVWNEGITNKGKRLADPTHKDYNPEFAQTYNQVFDKNGLLKEGIKLTPDQLKKLAPAYSDNALGIRSVVPSQMVNDVPQEDYPKVKKTDTELPPQPGLPNTGVTINPRFVKQPSNRFNESMHWDELAPGMMGLADSMLRDPELYNSAEFHQLRLKQLDPTAAMNANQADFNAVEATLNDSGIDGSGISNANKASLLGSKYKVNNQVQGNYDNQNVGIKNNEIAYNTQVRDKQSMADAQTRAQYYRDVQLGRENQHQQKLKSVEDLTRAIQLKRRQNNSGNLIMKLSPAYDQHGEYNGYQYMPILPPELRSGQSMGTNTQSQQTPGKGAKKTVTTTFKTADGRVIKTVDR